MTDEQFEDGESYNLNYMKDKITFRDIILQHLRKISDYASVEFRGGYWQTQPNPVAGSNAEYTIYIPDTREIYSNSIECFADMLYPYFDEQMEKAEQEAEAEKDKIHKDMTILKEAIREDKNPEEAKRYEREFRGVNDRLTYRTAKVMINRRLFRALCSFLYRKKYLELGSIED